MKILGFLDKFQAKISFEASLRAGARALPCDDSVKSRLSGIRILRAFVLST
jgi:hypothetical protein